jgi:TetR/AcrR family transcriptional repressor of nem operon
MRYPPEQKKNTHERIVLAASRVFREQGYRATGVDAAMKAAGMTAGGFYAHFPSKEALFIESLLAAFRGFRKRFLAGTRTGRGAASGELIRRYFEAQSRDEPGSDCPIPALAADVARSSGAVRETFEQEVQKTAAALAARLRGHEDETGDAALALLALGAGGVLLSRAVKSPALADRIREACLRFGAVRGQTPVQ